MTVGFCTLFDANYLPRGLVMHRSLRAVLPESRLHVFCMDDASKQLLDELAEPGLDTVTLAELERGDPDLAAVRPSRSQVEYYWTATPSVCRHVLERDPALDAITYLDADLMFFSSPRPLLDELGEDSILIVPHRFSPPWADHEKHGVYNVGWVTFRRDERGRTALAWWRDRCLEWCYAQVEETRFGDQKYLDDWPERFAGVHVLQHPGGGLGPWNVPRHRLSKHDGSITVDGERLVFFHYHALALHRPTMLAGALLRLDLPLGPHAGAGPPWSTGYPIGGEARAWLWEPYLQELERAYEDVRRVRPGYDGGLTSIRPSTVARRAARTAIAQARRVGELAPPTRSTSARSSAGDWQRGIAERMLERSRAELARPTSVPPFLAFRYALEAVLRDDGRSRPVRLLDIGCGTGQYSELVARWFPHDIEYTGCDISEEMVAAARREWPGRRFEVDDVLAPTLDYDTFDVLLAGALIDVLVEWRAALEIVLGSAAPYVILHRQRLSRSRTRVSRAAGYGRQRTYRTVISEPDLERIVDRQGRSVSSRVPVQANVATLVLRREAA